MGKIISELRDLKLTHTTLQAQFKKLESNNQILNGKLQNMEKSVEDNKLLNEKLKNY